MGLKELMSKIRQWDNQSARWITRHFYIVFFEIVLILIFSVYFINVLKVIYLNINVPKDQLVERLLVTQSVNSSIMVMLIFLNSFWMLYMFNGIIRMRSILKDISFHLSRRRDYQNKQK